MEERRRFSSVRQLELMVEFLEGHRDLALGRVRAKEARAAATRLWRECAETLNAEGDARTGREWAKVWNDYKCRIRAKLVSINASQRATGGGPRNAPTLTPLEEKVANILGKDIGPLPYVRQDQFVSNNNDDNLVEEQVDEQQQQLQDIEMCSFPMVSIDEIALLPHQTTPSPVRVQPLPVTPVPSLTGQAPSLTNTPSRPTETVRRVRERRRTMRASHVPTVSAQIQPARNALEESRAIVLRIEEMRAEAALTNAKAVCSFAHSFRLIAESIDKFSQKYCQPQNPEP